MKKILFVGHGMHTETASSRFFEIILEKQFQLDRVYLPDGPDHPFDLSLLERARGVDIVVLWQRDFLAPVFLGMGIPTVVIPMYDGSALFPDSHWLFAAEARFANFCLYLNERIRALGNASHILRYFPEPVPEAQRVRFDTTRPIIWTRRPNEGLNLQLVHKLLGSQITSIHVHDAPDPGVSWPAGCPRDESFGYTVTRTQWGQSKQPYLDALAGANVYFAPRLAEGIGMGFLEAMAHGMLVLAWDLPTHNEYVANWINGILYDANCSELHLPTGEAADRLGYQAWRTVVEGRKNWEASIPAILEWIGGTPVPTRTLPNPEALAVEIWNSFFAGIDSYNAFLEDHGDLIAYMSGKAHRRVTSAVHGEIADQVAVKSFTQISRDEIAELRESGRFDADWYIRAFPDVALLNMDPAAHYLWIGKHMGRPKRATQQSRGAAQAV